MTHAPPLPSHMLGWALLFSLLLSVSTALGAHFFVGWRRLGKRQRNTRAGLAAVFLLGALYCLHRLVPSQDAATELEALALIVYGAAVLSSISLPLSFWDRPGQSIQSGNHET